MERERTSHSTSKELIFIMYKKLLITSLSEYRERATISSNIRVSAWNSCRVLSPVKNKTKCKYINIVHMIIKT